eukprot:COSAG04_NODE_8356_length_986_cov_1.276212_1_plen_175_part_10
MEGEGDNAERFVLDALPMSQLLDRARALGCPQDVLDDLMDRDDPRAEVLRVVSENMGLEGSAPHVERVRALAHDVVELRREVIMRAAGEEKQKQKQRERRKKVGAAAAAPAAGDDGSPRPHRTADRIVETLEEMVAECAARKPVALELACANAAEVAARLLFSLEGGDTPACRRP